MLRERGMCLVLHDRMCRPSDTLPHLQADGDLMSIIRDAGGQIDVHVLATAARYARTVAQAVQVQTNYYHVCELTRELHACARLLQKLNALSATLSATLSTWQSVDLVVPRHTRSLARLQSNCFCSVDNVALLAAACNTSLAADRSPT